ncbi:MAG: amylosucrase, partial [Oscillospiraceae bacterium]|nr:amylosucrase [Oscillospiraceae bacterium]
PECHLLYNVTTMATTWHTVATKDVRLLRRQLDTVFALPGEYTFLNYLRCHDDIGWGLDYDYLEHFGAVQIPHKKFLNDYLTGKWAGSPARGELYNDDPRLGDARLCGTTASLCGLEAARYERDESKTEWAKRADLALHAYMFTLSGIPVLYSGDEIAQENDYGYHDDPLKAADSRYLHRGDFRWDLAERRSEEGSVEHDIFTGIGRMEALRRAHRVFDGQADTWTIDTGSNAVLGIGRYCEGEKLLAYFNFSETEEHVWPPEDGELTDLWTGNRFPAGRVTIPSGGFVWLLRDFRPGEGKQA